MTEPGPPLPATVTVTQSFTARLPAQRLLDQLAHIDPTPFGELAQNQPFRIVAFRALLRDFPGYDPTALWLHAYDVEVDIVEADPTNGKPPTPPPRSAATTAASPTTSTG
jgi:hypothetical protein